MIIQFRCLDCGKIVKKLTDEEISNMYKGICPVPKGLKCSCGSKKIVLDNFKPQKYTSGAIGPENV